MLRFTPEIVILLIRKDYPMTTVSNSIPLTPAIWMFCLIPTILGTWEMAQLHLVDHHNFCVMFSAVPCTNQPVIDPIADISSCNSYVLPPITGANLSGNSGLLFG